ncbi:aminopeptidase Q [Pelodiscus sinensis]|uniref:aminopeptidase Q n=1 Tax=Pelodiscus sinensis TaxID=13735 RepID=UPI000703F64D|nr:aminopeptidase Q [Pelodiscus sinensis]|eukprot:XP_014434715.1 aminopeptidase Q [Pelodiscus sinensis]
MGPKAASGFYLGRKPAALLALLLAALLLALAVLGALYGRCLHEAEELRAAEAPPSPTARPGTAGTGCCTPSPGSTRRPGAWDHPRLPGALLPLHYQLRLWPRVSPGQPAPFGFSGQVNITVRCAQDTDTVLLHSAQLELWGAAVRGPLPEEPARANGGGSIQVEELWLEEEREYAVLELRRSLLAGGSYVLQLSFRGTLSEELDGLFLTHYTDQGQSSMLIASQLEPTYARTVYPCFDEPAMKATFNIVIVHHPSYVALSNMPAIDKTEMKDENGSIWTVTTFNTTLKMSTYITAFVVCDFDYVSRTERGNEIRIWGRKEAIKKGYADYALNITGPLFSFLEDLFNISYPLSKTDLVALPDFGVGAMENWGLMTFQESSLMYNPSDKFRGKKAMICLIVSHELGHQWFGNLVTMNWWNDLWLNEGFASYFEYIGASYMEPRLSLNQIFYYHMLQPVLREDKEIASRSLSMREENIKGPFSLIGLFDIFTYSKGASIIRMLSSFLTDRLFFKALNLYLKAFSFSSASQDDLWTHIQMVVDTQNEVQLPAPVKNIMDSWTCQNGFPILTLNLSTGVISQKQFYNKRTKNDTAYNNTWIVPISWIRNGSAQPLVWLDTSSKMFPEMQISDSGHDWILLNMNTIGYYRVNYDPLYLKRLAQLLERDPKAIPVINRLHLLDDAFTLAEAGYIEIESAFGLTKYLAKEDQLFVWYTALSYLIPEPLENIVNKYGIYPFLKKYLLRRMLPIYHYYANIIRQNFSALADEFDQIYLEKLINTACWLGLQDCLNLSSELYTKWMENPDNEIPLTIKRTICCYGVAMGSEREWEFAWKMYNHNNSTELDKNIMLSALRCTRESWLLRRYLQYSLNNSFSNTTVIIISNVAATAIGHRIAWEFVTENWLLLNERNRILLQLLKSMENFVNTDLQIQELQLFYNTTLHEDLRISATEMLQFAKFTNKERRKVIARFADWLRKNIDD